MINVLELTKIVGYYHLFPEDIYSDTIYHNLVRFGFI